jgi:Ca-activated chloride channel family protein
MPHSSAYLDSSIIVLAITAGVGAQFAAGTDLVEVYATVMDPRGRPVVTLGRDDFEVRENGAVQRVTAFAVGDFPLSVAIALDRSWSMAGRPLDHVRDAARSFLAELRPEDEAMLVTIGSEVETVAPLSRDRAALVAAVDRLEPWGSTPLHDAIIECLDRIASARGRRALVILSDGLDRYSQASADDVRARAKRAGVLVYPVVIAPTTPSLLADLAEISGGRTLRVDQASSLARAFTDVAFELRHQYLLGYEPPAGPRGWRTISVGVSGQKLSVRARSGYVAP